MDDTVREEHDEQGVQTELVAAYNELDATDGMPSAQGATEDAVDPPDADQRTVEEWRRMYTSMYGS